jgi:hypothetical protein
MEGMVDRIDWGVLGMVDSRGGWSFPESTVVAVVLLFFVVSGQETKSTPTTLPTTTTIISRMSSRIIFWLEGVVCFGVSFATPPLVTMPFFETRLKFLVSGMCGLL